MNTKNVMSAEEWLKENFPDWNYGTVTVDAMERYHAAMKEHERAYQAIGIYKTEPLVDFLTAFKIWSDKTNISAYPTAGKQLIEMFNAAKAE